MTTRNALSAACVSVFCVALALAALGAGWGQEKSDHGKRGQWMGAGKGRGMQSEAMKAEFERHRGVMQALMEEAKSLKQEIKEAVHNSEDPAEDVAGAYRGQASGIAARMADERITHHEKVLSIARAEKAEMIERITNRLLTPREGRKGKGGKDKQETGTDTSTD